MGTRVLFKLYRHLAVIILSLTGCASPHKSPEPKPEPSWLKQSSRTMDGGYIIYVSSAEDHSSDRARFKAESSALQDLTNECSLAPKGVRIEDHYDQTLNADLHRSYAKVAIEFKDCEEAKQAVEPDQIRRLANISLTEQLKRYQEMVMSPEEKNEQAVALASLDNPESPSNAEPVNGELQDIHHFYWMRQRIVYLKQFVILSPPQTYASNPIVRQNFVRVVAAQSNQTRTFEKANPQLRTAPSTWSTQPRHVRLTPFRQRVTPNRNFKSSNVHPGQIRGKKKKRKSGLRGWNSNSD